MACVWLIVSCTRNSILFEIDITQFISSENLLRYDSLNKIIDKVFRL